MEVANSLLAILRRWLVLLLCAGLASAGSTAGAETGRATSGLGMLLVTLPGNEVPQIVNLDSPMRLADHVDRNAKDARFFGGNSRYFKIQNVGFKQDAFSVFSAATGQLEFAARRMPRVWEAHPAPTAAGVFAFVFLDTAGDTGLFAVVDVSSEQRVVASYKGEVGKYIHWWMPDGSVTRLHAHTGELSSWRGNLQGSGERIQWQVIGAMPPPLPGVIFGMASLSPAGNELVLSTVEKRTRRSDLWITDARGGALKRITADGFVSFVTWAPDGQHFLLQRSNVSSINTTFRGQCSYWIAPSSARNVSAIVPGVRHPAVTQVFYAGDHSPVSLPCGKVAAWVR